MTPDISRGSGRPGRTGTLGMTLEGMDEVKAQLEKLAREAPEGAKRVVTTTAYAIQESARRGVPVDQGEARSGVVVDVIDGGMQAKIRASAPHSAVIEEGRTPGSAMPPEEPIAAWMRRKGIDPELLFPIRRNIAEFGIDPHPFMAPAWDANKGAFEKDLKDALVRATIDAGGHPA